MCPNNLFRAAFVAVLLNACWATASLAESGLTPVISVTPSPLDFGCVAVGDTADVTADLFNSTVDPASLLEVTGITVTGSGFSLVSGPSLPVTIPGDGTVREGWYQARGRRRSREVTAVASSALAATQMAAGDSFASSGPIKVHRGVRAELS